MALSYAASWVEICNQALGRLGKGSIQDLDQGNQLSNYCSLYLGQTIEDIYAARDWTCCRKRAQLNQLVETPVFGPAYYYQLPVDFIRPVEVDTEGEDWSIEGDKVATDAEEVYLAYLARPEDPATLPGYMRKAISTRLAFLLSTPLTSSDALAARIAQEDRAALEEAVVADAARAQSEDPDSWYDEAR